MTDGPRPGDPGAGAGGRCSPVRGDGIAAAAMREPRRDLRGQPLATGAVAAALR